MSTYIIRRLLLGIVTIILVTVIIFLAVRLLPGDPLTIYVGSEELGELTPEQWHDLRVKFGLDKPLPLQYVNWLAGIFTGRWGKSIFYEVDVANLIRERMPVTAHLGLTSFVLSNILGLTFGVICALRRGKWIDTLLTFLANIGITIPAFWAGILLIYLLALQLGWLPTNGYTSPFDDFWMSTRQIIMPVICMSFFSLAALTRQVRSAMLEVAQQDYIRTAWAKGLRERMIIYRHAIKNALIPIITLMGLHIGIIFGGSVLIETVFNIPGVGRLMTQSVLQQDFPVVQAVVLIMAIIVVLVNLTVDISYGWLDPRIRYD